MKPPVRTTMNGFWVVSQLFEGYDGYVYEVVNPCSHHVVELFAFKGEKFPSEDDKFEVFFDLNDGIYWLKNNETRHERFLRDAEEGLKRLKNF